MKPTTNRQKLAIYKNILLKKAGSLFATSQMIDEMIEIRLKIEELQPSQREEGEVQDISNEIQEIERRIRAIKRAELQEARKRGDMKAVAELLGKMGSKF